MTKNLIRILLIDDDEDDFYFTKEIISEISTSRFELEWSNSHNKGLKAIIQNLHDVYLIDFRLGETTGMELLKKARNSGNLKPIIMLTGHNVGDSDLEAIKAGASDYLVKGSLNAEQLERSIRYSRERAIASERLLQSEQKITLLFKYSTDGIFFCDQFGYVQEGNDSVFLLLGYEASHQFSLRNCFLQQSKWEDFRDLISKNGEVRSFETILIHANGKHIHVLLSGSKSRGEKFKWQGIIHDITKFKKSEKEAILTEKLSITGRLARTMAHEIRNPLTNISLSVEQLKSELIQEPNEEITFYLDIIFNNVKRINSLLTELLNSAKPGNLTFEWIELSDLMTEINNLCQDRFILKSVILITSCETDYVWRCDSGKIKIALLNLLINAVEAMPEIGIKQVNFFAQIHDHKLIIKVSDTGIGIAREELGQLFDAFFTKKRTGTGLGLTATQNIVAQHGGTIEVESTVNQGTCFTLTFPIEQEYFSL